MNKSLLFLILVFLNNVKANDPTFFKWFVTSDSPPKGHCMEIDVKTQGTIYSKRVPSDKCRPKKEKITTMWMQNAEGPGGRCFEIDSEYQGGLYSRPVSQKDCEPKGGETHLIEGKCYYKGERGDGSIYLIAVSKGRCKPSEAAIHFIPSSNGLSGRCISLDSSTGQSFSEPLKKCKPNATEYISLDVKGEATCFEVAVDGGAANYIKKAYSKFCRPKTVDYLWVQDEPDSGSCYIISPDNVNYREKTAPKKCFKLYETIKEFRVLNPVRGQCFIIDKKERGGKLRQIIPTDSCLDLAEKLEKRLVSFQERPYCVEIDSEDPASGFRKSITLKKCNDHLGEYLWVLSDYDPFTGICYEKVALGGQVSYKGVQKKKCRTPETVFKWLVKSKEEVLLGKCYEIDKERGPEGFILKVSKKMCRPKDNLVVKFFHPKEFKKGGCYMVDKETLGGRFSVRTDDKKCKDELFPVKR